MQFLLNLRMIDGGATSVMVDTFGWEFTVMKNRTAGEIRRLGQNNGWHSAVALHRYQCCFCGFTVESKAPDVGSIQRLKQRQH